MASLVSPIKQVSVPVQIEWQDTVISGEELGISGDFASKLQHVDVGDSSIYKPWIYGNKVNNVFYELKKKSYKKDKSEGLQHIPNPRVWNLDLEN